MPGTRLQVWSAHAAEQQLLESRPFGGALPDTPGPFAGLVVNNAAGTKLDYYLGRSLVWAPGACTDTDRSVTATVTLSNPILRQALVTPLRATVETAGPCRP